MIELTNQRVQARFETLGAQLTGLLDRQTGKEVLWSGDPQYWRFQAPILFPIVGRLVNDQYTYQGQTYPMHQHGFARESKFKLVSQTETTVTFELTQAPATQTAQYPFKFVFRVRYQLENDGVRISYQVSNPATEPLLFSAGAHPAFNMALNSQREFDDVQLTVTPAQSYSRIKLAGPYSDLVHPANIDLQQPLPIQRQLFEHDALILALKGADTTVKLTDRSHHGIALRVTGAPYVGVWSPYPKQAPFICIEPWWGIADTTQADGQLQHKAGINQLAGGQSMQMGYQLQLI